MKSLEDRLSAVRPPDVSVPSHRDNLARALRTAPQTHTLARRPLAVALAGFVLLLGGLTVVHPSWAKDLARLIFVGERVVTTTDGRKLTERTYRVDPSSTDIAGQKTVQVRTGANGEVTSSEIQSGMSPEFQRMTAEAAEQVRQGTAQLYVNTPDLKTYRIRLKNGREILYTVGPGSSQSVSEFTPQNP